MQCDIAFVSHHAEPPDLLHARILAQAGDQLTSRVMERLYPRIRQIATESAAPDPTAALRLAVADAIFQETGRTDIESATTSIFRQYALPLAERILRHQVLQWAADIATRRGWVLKVFGRAWESGDFAAFAAGPVEHGEELRACYQSAAIHLHASLTTLTHQRIMECALSGGLPVCRLTPAAIEQAMQTAKRDAWLHSAPEHHDAATGRHGFVVADSPHLMAAMALRQRLGLDSSAIFWSGPANMERLRSLGGTPLERRAEWLLGDLAETTFRTPAELEAIIARALESPAWRDGWSRCIAARVRQRLTLPSMVQQMLDMIARSLATDARGGCRYK